MKAKGAGGQGKVGARIVGPTHKAVPCRVEAGPGAESSVVRWTAPHEGPYEVEVTYDGHPVPGSPFPDEAGRDGGRRLGGSGGGTRRVPAPRAAAAPQAPPESRPGGRGGEGRGQDGRGGATAGAWSG